MLYLTTRGQKNSYTAGQACRENRGPDGGLFFPMHLPSFDSQELARQQERPFSQNLAEILNLFFSPQLEAKDVEAAAGKHPVRLTPQGHRLVIAETWHGGALCFSELAGSLAEKVGGRSKNPLTGWTEIAVRIAMLFAVFAEMGEPTLDVAVACGDFSPVMAAWYAREMGLGIGNIVFACNENGGVWDLLNHGELRTDGVAVATNTPEGDLLVPTHLERLIRGTLGLPETLRFSEACRKGTPYRLSAEHLPDLRRGLYSAVVSQSRVEAVIRSVKRSRNYVLDPYGALAYAGLQDYRAGTGESRDTLLLAEHSPLYSAPVVAGALKLSLRELEDQLTKT